MTRYATVHTKLWQDNKFRALDDNAKTLFLYLLTCPHGNLIGFYYLPKAYIAADLGRGIEGVSKGLQDLIDANMIRYDEDSQVVLIVNFLKYNPISNENQAKGAIQQVRELPKTALLSDFLQCVEAYCKQYASRFEALSKPLQSPLEAPSNGHRRTDTETDTDTDTEINNNSTRASANASADDCPNNQQIIAELVKRYREIPGVPAQRGDYAFIGRCYNEFGYDQVLLAINNLGYKMERGFKPDNPLIYLRGILKRAPDDAQVIRGDPKRKKYEHLYE